MSKFIFSLFANDKVKSQIIFYANEEKSEFGYKYIKDWKNFYDEIFGMDDNKFYSNETQFF